jgi:hypothetical protein
MSERHAEMIDLTTEDDRIHDRELIKDRITKLFLLMETHNQPTETLLFNMMTIIEAAARKRDIMLSVEKHAEFQLLVLENTPEK